MDSTTAALERAAGTVPGARALIAERCVLSYRELDERARECAAAMRSIGIRRAALIADNSADWIVADLGAQLAGIVLVPVPGFFSKGQLEHAVRDSGADALIADSLTAVPIGALGMQRSGVLTGRLVCYRRASARRSAVLPWDTAKISYTSGTTGEPKGVCLSQEAMDRVADSLVEATADLGLCRHLCLLPLALLLENIAGVYAPLRNGGEICVPGLASIGWSGAAQLDSSRVLDNIRRYQPDSVILVPQMLTGIVEALERGAPAPGSLTFVAVGGAHAAPALLDRAERLGLPVYQGYGLTETASVVALSSPKQRRAGSVGRPLAHCGVRIDAGGEIVVAGATCAGYVGKPSIVGEVATGDLGRIDEDGYLYVLGRRKNVFITSFGRNVSPDWIEAEFSRMPSIAQIAIFGEARPWNTAVVVPAAHAQLAELDSDIATVNATLPDYARVGARIVADGAFTPAEGSLTGNGRNRREAIWQIYEHRINACYDDCVSQCASQ
jgi:long-subunit acyl-CoA synthetase (AMP-forming)